MSANVVKVDLPAEIFDVQVNIPLIHQVVVAQQAAARQGTHSTKTRGEVRGGGRKPYKQKGTGRARQGSTRAPQFAGGGIVHGPQPRSYDQRTPKKMKAAALRGALSDRARAGRIHVVDGLVEGDKPSTKAAIKALTGLVDARKVLVVLERGDNLTWLSLRNESERAPARRRPAQHLRRAGRPTTWSSPRARTTRSWPARARASPSRPGPTSSTDETRRPAHEHLPQGPPRRPDRAGRQREELRPARRQQVHLPGAPGRQQDRRSRSRSRRSSTSRSPP